MRSDEGRAISAEMAVYCNGVGQVRRRSRQWIWVGCAGALGASGGGFGSYRSDRMNTRIVVASYIYGSTDIKYPSKHFCCIYTWTKTPEILKGLLDVCSDL